MPKLRFNNQKSPFFHTLKGKVDNYFQLSNRDRSGNGKLYFKGAILVLSAIALYVTLVFFTPSLWIALPLCCLFGVSMALIGFNIMHEGGHSSFSRYKWLNRLGAYSLNAMGGTTFFWKVTHNINHHTYTNIEGMDGDIELEPFMRLHENQRRHSFHRYQHLYWLFLYGFSYLAWIMFNDFKRYFSGNIGVDGSSKKLELREHLIFWSTKSLYLFLYLILPALLLGVGKAVTGFIIVTFICGLFISIVFQLAHIVEPSQFPVPEPASNTIQEEWAIHQVRTTGNFATQSKVVSWMLGGLNFQVEHHLFPRISHIHYPQINRFVRETCREFNVSYTEFSSVFKALGSHVAHLKVLGRE